MPYTPDLRPGAGRWASRTQGSGHFKLKSQNNGSGLQIWKVIIYESSLRVTLIMRGLRPGGPAEPPDSPARAAGSQGLYGMG